MADVSLKNVDSNADKQRSLSAQVRHRSVGEDGVLVHLRNGRVIVVNEVGLFIVQLLQQPMSTAMLAQSISAEFDVSLQQAEADLSKFLPELDQENILEPVE